MHGPINQQTRLLTELNKQYAVVLDGGKTWVLTFKEDEQHIGRRKHTRLVLTFISFVNFRNLQMNRYVTNKKVPLGKWWLSNPRRMQYDGLVFQPGGADVINKHLNLWCGFGVVPKAGDWSLMKEHIRVVLASCNGETFQYILNWLAWAVQHPDQRAEVALVFRGARGVGKGTLGNAMMVLLGQHGVHISNAKHLTGFNAHLRDACFLFADEAYWPGDKSAEGDFKRLITEPRLFIEGKGKDAVSVPNMLHVMMASNENWIVPAGERERRFAPFDVSDVHIQDEPYFNALYAQLEDGGYEAMLHELLHMKLGDWHPRRLPKTAALVEQQRQSLDPYDAWWVELLECGVIEGASEEFPSRAISNEFFHNAGSATVKLPGMFTQARRLSPKLRHFATDTSLGHYLRKQGCKSGVKVRRRRGWEFPPLRKCRKAWEARFPGWEWRDPKITEWLSDNNEAMNSGDDDEE